MTGAIIYKGQSNDDFTFTKFGVQVAKGCKGVEGGRGILFHTELGRTAC